MAWTEERVELLKKLWIEGLSASQIAGELGGVTRNAVIGKIHRLGLSGRANRAATSNSRRKTANVRTAPAAKPVRTTANAKPAAPVSPKPAASDPGLEKPDMLMLDLLQLTDQTCKFPIGDPQEEGFAFCGVKSRDGDPYCDYHCHVAYQPAAERRQKGNRGSGKTPLAPPPANF